MAFPRAGRDYPRTVREFRRFFPSERSADEWLVKLRWPGGWTCSCGETRYWWRERGQLICVSCETSLAPTAETILGETNIPALDWLQLAWELTARPSGVSTETARGLLGLSYDSTWRLLHKLRRAMAAADARTLPLPGPVEVDEVFLGGAHPGVPGRGALGKQMLLVIVGRAPVRGKVLIRRIPKATARSILPIISASVRPGATVITDGMAAYTGLPRYGYRHTRYRVARLRVPAHFVLPAVHSVAAQFKRTWLSTWGGGVGLSQLDWYAAEFAFRFNRRHYKYRGRAFYDLVSTALSQPYRTGASITRGR